MIACNKENNKWSEKKMERDDGLRTVECLRGRLLAERQASKTAKEDAELMGNKLIELENELKEETKLRNKAEKRLKLLRNKLESLKLLPILEESEQSSSSEHCADSGVSSTSGSGARDPEESASKSQNAVPEISKNMDEYASDTTTSIKSFEISFSKENSNSPGTTKSDTKDSSHEKSSVKSSSGHEDPKIDDTSSSSLKASTVEIDMNGRNENYENYENDDYVDNSLALIPLTLPETKLAPEIKIISKSIGEVLDTLRHARERIQSSMERRQMIKSRAILNSYKVNSNYCPI